ncbi:MAG: aspartyl beta-hydroxylase [Sphingomonadales bacterium]|nr:MAG: aspartyl beta-hydroxylase [Sphingomonadales bacterium]
MAQPWEPDGPDRIELGLRFDANLLADDLATLRPTWRAHFVRANYEGDWSAFPLRAPAGETHPIRMLGAGTHVAEFVDCPALDATPYFRAVLSQILCPLRGVRLMRLARGSAIKEHSDPDMRVADGFARLHVPIATDTAVEFMLNRLPVTMTPGSLWYLRLSDPHSVTNRGSRDRVHLVIDVAANDWLRDRLAEGAAAQVISASA